MKLSNRKTPKNGYILHHDVANHVVVIATGITDPSENSKTGPMIQPWILRDGPDPVEAIARGFDESICFDCRHRGDVATGRKRSCYVNVGQAPLAVFGAFARGSYEFLPIEMYGEIFAGREIRLGAYGDPFCIPQAHRCAALLPRITSHRILAPMASRGLAAHLCNGVMRHARGFHRSATA